MGSHEENNAAQRKYFAIDDLKRAAHLIERSIGAFHDVDDKNLTIARSFVAHVMDCNKIETPKAERIGGDVPL